MSLRETERRNPRSAGLGAMSPEEVVRLMNEEETRSLEAVSTRAAVSALAAAAEAVAERIGRGGHVYLLGAGTGGRVAVQEQAEMHPTFGVPDDLFVALTAGGPTMGPAAITRTEDDADTIRDELARRRVGAADAVIGLAASGTTPFVVEGLRSAAAAGAWTCGITSCQGSPLEDACGLAIVLSTGPEVLTGSTRLKAATAQKLALNRISLAAMVRCGHVVGNHMVDVTVVNDKLRDRAVRIVTDLTGAPPDAARAALQAQLWSVREALAVIGMPE